MSTWAAAGWTPSIPRTGSGSSGNGATACDTGKVFDSRYRVRTKSGSYRHYDVRAVPIERDGKIIEWVGASTDVTGQREAEEMRGRLTEQLSAAALRTVPAAAGDVDAGRGAHRGAGRRGHHRGRAVGDRRRALGGGDARPRPAAAAHGQPGGAAGQPGRADRGHAAGRAERDDRRRSLARRPLLVESPDGLRRHFEGEARRRVPVLQHSDEQAWVGLPLLSSGAPLGALRFSFTRPRTDHRRGAGVPGGAGRPVRAGAGAGHAVRAGAHHRGDAAAQPAAGHACRRARGHPGGQVPAGHQEHGDRRRLVRRVPAARTASWRWPRAT